MKSWNFWIVVRRAPDIPGIWIAHCLDLNVLSEGESLSEAIESIPEAVAIVVGDALAAGIDPLRHRAPQHYWDDLNRLLRDGVPAGLPPDALDAQAATLEAVALQLRVTLQPAQQLPRAYEVPMFWSQQAAA